MVRKSTFTAGRIPDAQFDAIVVGAGVVGLAMSLGLALRGFRVAVIDQSEIQADLSQPDPRVYAINTASQQLLSDLGAWDCMPSERVSRYQHMMIWDAATAAELHFDCREIAQDKLGCIIEESVLRSALLQGLGEQANVCFFPQQKIQHLGVEDARHKGVDSARQIFLQSESGSSWIASTLFAADGAHSTCRKLLEVPLITRPYHHHAIITQVTTEFAHNHTAYQVFLKEGPLAFLPLVSPYQSSIVWSTTEHKARMLMQQSSEQFHTALEEAFAGKLGRIQESSQRYVFPLWMRHAKQYVGDSWVLLGDAAHTIHPLAGLGLNLGLADVALYLKHVENAGKKEQNSAQSLLSKRQLTVYQRERKARVTQVMCLMQAVKSLFTNSCLPIQWIRGVGLIGCNKNPLLKALAIQFANE